MNRLSFVHCFAASILGLCLACAADVAPANSTLTVLPASLTLDAGVTGSNTYGAFVVEVKNEKNNPIDGLTVSVSSFLTQIIDEDGNLVNGGTPVPFTSDENGQVVFFVKVPLGVEFEDTLQIQSGAASTTVEVTASAPSDT